MPKRDHQGLRNHEGSRYPGLCRSSKDPSGLGALGAEWKSCQLFLKLQMKALSFAAEGFLLPETLRHPRTRMCEIFRKPFATKGSGRKLASFLELLRFWFAWKVHALLVEFVRQTRVPPN